MLVHHKTGIEDGGAIYDTKNLEALCVACHASETRRELTDRRRGYMRGHDANGMPLDPNHPWNHED